MAFSFLQGADRVRTGAYLSELWVRYHTNLMDMICASIAETFIPSFLQVCLRNPIKWDRSDSCDSITDLQFVHFADIIV